MQHVSTTFTEFERFMLILDDTFMFKQGVLRNGQVVAVKKLLCLPGMHDKHFENEVYHLTRLKHENIVRIVGYCYEIQHILIEHNKKIRFAEMPQRLLCLEFLPKGSLEKHISGMSNTYEHLFFHFFFLHCSFVM